MPANPAFRNYNTYFFFLILALVTIASLVIFKPFMSAILAGGVLAIIFQGPFLFFLRLTGERRAVSSFLTSLLVVLVVVVPLFVVAGLITSEVNIFFQNFLSEGDYFKEHLSGLISTLNGIPLVRNFDLESAFTEAEFIGSLKNFSSNILGIIQGAYERMAGFVLWVFAMFFSLYYFLIDGERIVRKVLYLSPLKDEHEKIIIERFNTIVRSVMKGVVIIGLVQSTLGGLAFAIAGVPSPIIWGIIMFFFSLIPMVGTSLIWFPTGVILLLGGSFWEGIFILAFGLVVISTIDNLIRPKLVGRGTQIHPLLIFFATLGGLLTFGPTGFILGPLIVAMTIAFWNIYAAEYKDEIRKLNA